MKLNSDDPRLTAFALGELDAAERKAVEAELDNTDECRHEVEEIARTAALLHAELAAEPLPGLTYAQQLAIEAKLMSGSGKAGSRDRSLLSVSRERNIIRLAVDFVAAVAMIMVAVIATSRFATHSPPDPRQASSPIAQTVKEEESDVSRASDAAFARWAAPYQRLQIPLVPLEETANYVPPEILPIGPAPAIRNSKS